MKIPKFDDLKTCSECKHPFKVKATRLTTKRCYCSEYVYNSYPSEHIGEYILSITRSAQSGKDVYTVRCHFTGSKGRRMTSAQLPTKETEIEYCILKLFLNGNASPINIEIPDGMLGRIPILEDNKKLIKFCDLVRILK